MKKLTKVGLTALCGSLAAIASANAGEMSVSGGATASWSSNSGDVTGNPIGLNSGMTFVGSGELDNGTTFTLTLTHADQDAYSVGSIALTMPTLGSISIAQNTGGNGIGGYDDKMPTAWEETWGTSLGTSIDLAKGVSSSMNVQYKTPSFAGTTIAIAYAPKNDGAMVNDKGVSGGGTSHLGAGYDIVLDSTISGQNIFLGYSTTERSPAKRAAGTNINDGPEQYQITGIVTDAVTGEPLNAKVWIDELNGPMLKDRYSDDFGRYHRLLIEGTYTIHFDAFGYEFEEKKA